MSTRPRNPFVRAESGEAECPVDAALSVVGGRWKGSMRKLCAWGSHHQTLSNTDTSLET